MTLADRSGLPDGYTAGAIGGTRVVAREGDFDAIVSALREGTLHAWASAQAGARAMQGRGVAWATKLPNGPEVVVRHSQHGGMLAAITRDLFLAPTRAPQELDIAVRLKRAGVATPEVIAYAVYSVAGPLCRADVVTARIDAVDLPAALNAADREARERIWTAIESLLWDLCDAHVLHPDLNARNILIDTRGGGCRAWMIDVDRARFADRASNCGVESANALRLGSSLRKLHMNRELAIDFNVAFQFVERLHDLGTKMSSGASRP